MADAVGQVVCEEDRHAFLGGEFYGTTHPKDYSEATGREIDLAVRGIVADTYARASQILDRRREDLTAGAALLLARETLTADEFPAMKPSPD